MENVEIRRAVPGDEPVILEFIRELAEYEHCLLYTSDAADEL